MKWFELKNIQEEEMTKEELIKKVEELENEIETLHAELRMAYKEKPKEMEVLAEKLYPNIEEDFV